MGVDQPSRGNVDGQVIPQTSPFGATKTADQVIQFGIDPSFGLTKKRYSWFSNGTLFDSSLVSEVESGIRLATTATSGDEVRIRSAYAGQYVSQALAQPGMGYVVDDGNVSTDASNLSTLSHGELYTGAFYWDSANNQVDTGVGFKIDDTNWQFFIKSLGNHIGPSPINQADWSGDSYDGTGKHESVVTPADGFVANWPFTWYNQGPLGAALLDKEENKLREVTTEHVNGRPSTDSPNLPIQMVVRNAGTASSLGVGLGGMQFSTYGAGPEDIERRTTPETRVQTNGYVSDQRVLTENAVDPTGEPGKPLVSVRRESGREGLGVRLTSISCQPLSDDIYVFQWDEYDPGTALTGATFNDPVSPNSAGTETHLLTDTQATDYTPTGATFRGLDFFESGATKEEPYTDTLTDIRIPIGATRVVTAVNSSGTAADVNPFKVDAEEAY
jgi:hypothetical protein